MIKYTKIIFTILLMASALFVSCGDDDPTDYHLSVICEGGTFTGSFQVDGGAFVPLTVTLLGGTTYVSEYDFKDIETLVVRAYKGDVLFSLSVYIYKDDELVETDSSPANHPSASDPTLDLNVIYQESATTTTTK